MHELQQVGTKVSIVRGGCLEVAERERAQKVAALVRRRRRRRQRAARPGSSGTLALALQHATMQLRDASQHQALRDSVLLLQCAEGGIRLAKHGAVVRMRGRQLDGVSGGKHIHERAQIGCEWHARHADAVE